MLGRYLVFYTQTEGVILNVFVSIVAIITCSYSFKQMANSSGTKFSSVVNRAFTILGVQVLAVISAVALCFLIAVFMDLVHMPMSWFTNSWLILGLYFCPLFFGFAIVPALYFHSQRKVSAVHLYIYVNFLKYNIFKLFFKGALPTWLSYSNISALPLPLPDFHYIDRIYCWHTFRFYANDCSVVLLSRFDHQFMHQIT